MNETNLASAPDGSVLNPEPSAETIELAIAAAQRLDWQAAASLWNSVLDRSPGHIQASLGAAKALGKTGRHDAAETILAAAANRFPDHEAVAVAQAWSATYRRDWSVALQRWEDVSARFPDNPQACQGLGQALRGANRLVELRAFLDTLQALVEAEEVTPTDPKTLLDLATEIARLQPGWPALRRCAERIIARKEQQPVSVYLALSQAALHMGDKAAAELASSHVLAANPRSTETLLLLVKLSTERGDGEATLSCYQKLAALHPNNAQWRVKAAQLLSWLGRVEEAMSEAAAVLARWPQDQMVRAFIRNFGLAAEMLPDAETAARPAGGIDPDAAGRNDIQALIDRAPAVPATARPAIPADPRRDVIIPDGADSDTAILIFAGINDALSMPVEVFDLYMRKLDLMPIYLRDFSRLRYLTGIRSLSDSYQGTIEALRGMLRERGVKRLFTLGNCIGGSAAIRYGVELGAECIAAFHTPTYCPPDHSANLQVGHRFLRKRLAARVADEMTDLRPFLEQRACLPRIELFYDAENQEDQRYAERIGHIGNVHLNPLPGRGAEHTLRKLVMTEENFSQWLDGMLAGTGLRASGVPYGGGGNLPAAAP